MDISGRHVLVTGGLGYLTTAIASAFADAGDSVTILDWPKAIQPQDVANLGLIPAWGAARMISGQNIGVDGGW